MCVHLLLFIGRPNAPNQRTRASAERLLNISVSEGNDDWDLILNPVQNNEHYGQNVQILHCFLGSHLFQTCTVSQSVTLSAGSCWSGTKAGD